MSNSRNSRGFLAGIARLSVGILVVVSLASLVVPAGCNSEPKDPFSDMDAAAKYNEYVPPTATSLASGAGTLTCTVPADGVLFLIDSDARVKVDGFDKPTVLTSGLLRKGAEVIFDPNQRSIHLKGREGVELTKVDPTHVHEFRFDPSGKTKK